MMIGADPERICQLIRGLTTGLLVLWTFNMIPLTTSFNVVTNRTEVIRNPVDGSSLHPKPHYFGYDFAWSPATVGESSRATLLIGSPRTGTQRPSSSLSATSSSPSNHPGEIFTCGIPVQALRKSPCRPVKPSSDDLEEPDLLTESDSFGLSILKSQGPHTVQDTTVCAPLRMRNCGSEYLTQGACFSSTNFGKTWSKDSKQASKYCPMVQIDLIFVLDGSGSVNANDPRNFGRVKDWVKQVSATFDMSEFARVGVVQYSHWYVGRTEQPYVVTEIELGEYNDQKQFEEAVDEITVQGYTTYTAHAINKTVEDFKASERYNDTSARKVMILLTDGRSNDAEDLPYAAEYAREAGITTFAVGVAEYSPRELQIIATGVEGDNSRVYGLQRFSDLQKIVGSLRKSITGILEGGAGKNETNALQQSEVGIGGVISEDGERMFAGQKPPAVISS